MTRDLDHVRWLAARLGAHLDGLRGGLRGAREVAKRCEDEDPLGLLTGMVERFERHARLLHVTLGG